VQVDELPHQRKADAHAPLRAVGVVVGLVEQVEDVRQRVGRDADARVDDVEPRLLAVALERHVTRPPDGVT
jgi:hypothetical protein